MRSLLVPATVTLALTFAGCVAPSDGTPSSEDLARFGVEPEVNVELDEGGFRPATLDIAANSTLSVTNAGVDPHAVLQIDTPPDRRIETGDLVPGETVAIHVADPGTIELTDPRTGAILTVDVGPAEPVS